MLAFIQSQPSVVERLIKHIETTAISDLLFRIIQLDEHPSGTGVLEVLLSGVHVISCSPSYTVVNLAKTRPSACRSSVPDATT
jgi:SIT4 phosphatase-associated protein